MDKLYDLIQEINPKEICNHIENGNLAEWCNAWRIAAKEALQPKTNADRIRSMNDEELAEFLTHMNPTNCQECAFSHGWSCQPDRDDYSDLEKCEEGRKRWLKQPAEEG